MKLGPKAAYLAAYAALFAVCAAFVFWGTWSTGVSPVMPDCPISHPEGWWANVSAFLREWVRTGLFSPDDLKAFAGAPYFLQELQYAVPAFLAGLAVAYYCRGRGLSRLASYSAGIFLSLSGYWFTLFSAGHLGWFQWMTYGVFAFGLIDRALEKGKPRHWLLLGACLAWGSMHQPDLWLLFSVFSAAYFVFRLLVVFVGMARDARRAALVKWAKGAAMALAALLAIGGASFRSAFVNDLAGRDKQIEEGQTLGANAAKDDAEKRWIFVTNWSMPPEATKEFWHAGIEGDTSCPMTLAIGQKRGNGIRQYTGALGRPLGAKQGNYRQHSLYVGWVTCFLAVLGLLSALLPWLRDAGHETRATGDGQRSTMDSPSNTNNSAIIFFAVSAVVFWLFSMGRYCEPVYRLVYALPFGDYLRAPVKWHHLTEFCLCVLAGYGLAMLRFRFVPSALRKASPDSSPAANRAALIATSLVAMWVVIGLTHLVPNARLYCAPHRADADMQFVDGRMLQDPRGVAQLNQMRARVLGTYQGAALIEVPKKKPKDEPAPELPSPQPVTLALGILSLVGTLAVGAYGIKKS